MGWAPGLDARAIFHAGPQDVTLRFLGGFNWDGTGSTSFASGQIPTITTLYINSPTTEATEDYGSSLNSIELDVGKALGSHAQLFAGLRVLKLDETLHDHINLNSGANIADVTWTVGNLGIGPQAGSTVHFGDRAFLDLDGRVGLLWTTSALGFNVTQTVGSPFSASGNVEGWAPVAEAGIAAGFKIHDHASIKIGYRVLYVHNLPTAASSIAATNPTTQTIGHSSQDVLVHGATIGFSYEF